MSTISELTSLQNTLNSAIDVFKAELAAQNFPEPSLNTSQTHPMDEPTFLPSPRLYVARKAVLASLGLIKLLVASPYDIILSQTWSSLEVASMRLVAEMEVPGILASAPNPEKGLTVDEISRETGVNAVKLEGILRLLLTQGWFRESQPGYFANSRLTNLVKKGSKTYFLPTYMNNLIHRVSVSLPEMINHDDPEFRHSTDPAKTAFQLQYKTDLPFLGVNSWLSKNPGDAYGFGQSMGGIGLTSDPGILADFPWEAILQGKDAIIDVGGGQGTLCCSLAAKFPNVKATFIVQDLPGTRDVAEKFIQSQGQTH
ncbi:hypothetical protein HGRIS_007547 [Hohenbuehelia grisea]|uniref:O-methyltransferase domain-containing protein n=1 Tax=Hohenbuehelia grisea TaxID=104357 RepID=A0ABR3J557_9AGAR